MGRFTRYAAAAALAKIYLITGDLPQTGRELEEIIDSGNYSLDANNDGSVNAGDYRHMFQPNTKNCKASVLEIQYIGGENMVNSNHQLNYLPWHFAFHLPGQTGAFVDYPFTMKFYYPNWRYPGQNFEIIRYADILLMYSEVIAVNPGITQNPGY